jgi:hypothetical protein
VLMAATDEGEGENDNNGGQQGRRLAGTHQARTPTLVYPPCHTDGPGRHVTPLPCQRATARWMDRGCNLPTRKGTRDPARTPTTTTTPTPTPPLRAAARMEESWCMANEARRMVTQRGEEGTSRCPPPRLRAAARRVVCGCVRCQGARETRAWRTPAPSPHCCEHLLAGWFGCYWPRPHLPPTGTTGTT